MADDTRTIYTIVMERNYVNLGILLKLLGAGYYMSAEQNGYLWRLTESEKTTLSNKELYPWITDLALYTNCIRYVTLVAPPN